jgi:hypothetical protein
VSNEIKRERERKWKQFPLLLQGEAEGPEGPEEGAANQWIPPVVEDTFLAAKEAE